MTALESLFGQQLLSRTKQGVEPTEAGRVLYRHARVILRQLEQAQAEVEVVGRELAGGVSVGLAPYSTVTPSRYPCSAPSGPGTPGFSCTSTRTSAASSAWPL